MPKHKGHSEGDSCVLWWPRPSWGMVESWASFPYCFESPQLQRNAPASGLMRLLSLRKLSICLVLNKLQPLTWEFVHTRPQRHRRQSFCWNEGSAWASWTLLTPVSCVLSLPPILVLQGKNPTLSSETTAFSPEGAWHLPAICLPFHLTRGEQKGQIQGLGNNHFCCSETGHTVVQTLGEGCSEAERRKQIRKKQNVS